MMTQEQVLFWNDIGTLIGFLIVLCLPLVMVLAIPALLVMLFLMARRRMRKPVDTCRCGAKLRGGLCMACGATQPV